MNKRFEHTQVEADGTDKSINDVLMEHEDEGWELVSTICPAWRFGIILFFKRPIENE